MPKKKREAKQAWITEEILQKMKERKKYKGTVTYTKLDKVKRAEETCKVQWLDQRTPQIWEPKRVNSKTTGQMELTSPVRQPF